MRIIDTYDWSILASFHYNYYSTLDVTVYPINLCFYLLHHDVVCVKVLYFDNLWSTNKRMGSLVSKHVHTCIGIGTYYDLFLALAEFITHDCIFRGHNIIIMCL